MAIVFRKRKKGSVHLVRVKDRIGSWYPAKSFARKIDAEAHERALLIQRDNGSRATPTSMRRILFKDYFARWAAECRGNASAGWRDSQDRMAKRYVLPMLGNLKLQDITGHDISQTLDRMRKLGLAPATVRLVYATLHKLFGDAVDEYEVLTTNPVRKKYRPVVKQKERAFLKPSDAWKLLEVATHDPLGPAVWIATLSGLRPGEIQALKVKALDFDQNQILIQATFCRRSMVLQDHPKQGDWGRAPIAPPLREYLLSIVAGRGPDEFVVSGERNEMLSHNAFLRNLTALCSKAGVKRITPHELRHSCTELYVQEGASIEDLRRLLNHSCSSVTERYVHRTDDRLNALAAAVTRPQPVLTGLRLVKR